jgi:formate dehydrogenase maturation protein FdhE
MQKRKASLASTAAWTAAVSLIFGVLWIGLNREICRQCQSSENVVDVTAHQGAHGNRYWYCKRCHRYWSTVHPYIDPPRRSEITARSIPQK